MTDDDITADLSSEVHRSVEPNAHSNTNWKVLGELEASDGVGVVGHNTAESGATRGVAGIVDSVGTDATGVYGVTDSRDSLAAGVRASATAGGVGIYASASDNAGILATTYGPLESGVFGYNVDANGGGVGVKGRTRGSGDGAAGVRGYSSAGSGEIYGVEGVTDSNDWYAAGVRGEATGTSGGSHGVFGTTGAPGQNYGPITTNFYAAGVRGRATANSGTTDATAGVVGRNDSTSGVGHGVVGKNWSENLEASAIKAEAGLSPGLRSISASGTSITVEGVSRSSDTSPTVGEHASWIADSSAVNSSVLALQAGYTASASGGAHNFITFYDSTGAAVGRIENDGSGGVNQVSGGADYAELLPQVDPDEALAAGDVVGVEGGAITVRTADADDAMVITDQAVVTGNAPGVSSEAREDHEPVAFVGQVPVRARGTVAEGDLIVPSGEHDGTARAIDPTAWRPGDGPLVGRAWEESGTEDVERITVAVGLETGEALEHAVAELGAELEDREERIATLEAEKEALREDVDGLASENEALRDRLAAHEERLARLESGQSSPAVADD